MTPDGYALSSLFVEAVLYGFLVFLNGASVLIIVHRRKTLSTSRRGSLKVLLITLLMTVFATLSIGLNFRSTYYGLIDKPPGQDEGPSGSFVLCNTVQFLVLGIIYCLQTILGDSFALYRVYVVWNGDKRIMAPLVALLLAIVACGILCIAQVPHDVALGEGCYQVDIEHPKWGIWGIALLSLTLVLNVGCTVLLASRIWWSQRRTRTDNRVDYRSPPVLVSIIIIESATIYSASLILTLALFVFKFLAGKFMLDAMMQIIAIVFSLITVRVALGLTTDRYQVSPSPRFDQEEVSPDFRRTPTSSPQPLHSGNKILDIGKTRTQSVQDGALSCVTGASEDVGCLYSQKI